MSLTKPYIYAMDFSSERELALAYAEYFDKVQNSMLNMASLITMGVDDPTANVDDLYSSITEPSFTLDSKVLFDNHAYTVRNIVEAYQTYISNQNNLIDNDEPSSIIGDITVIDDTGSSHVIRVEDLSQYLNAHIHSATVESAVGYAMAGSSSIAERLTILRDTVSSTFASGYTDISNSLNFAIRQIKQGAKFTNYLASKLVFSQLDQMAETGSFNNTEEGTYTGANSFVAAAMYTSNKILSTGITGIRATFKAVEDLLKGLTVGTLSLFKKGLDWVKVNTVDTIDLTVVNDNGNYTVDGFSYNYVKTINEDSKVYKKLAYGPIHMDFAPCEIVLQLTRPASVYPYSNLNIEESISKIWELAEISGSPDTDILATVNAIGLHVNPSWVDVDTIYTGLGWIGVALSIGVMSNTILGRFQNILYYYWKTKEYVYPQVTFCLKPKAINWEALQFDAGAVTFDDPWYVYNEAAVTPFFTKMVCNPTCYICQAPSEGQQDSMYYRSLGFGMFCSILLLQTLDRAIWNYDASDFRVTLKYSPTEFGMWPTFGGSVTNADYVSLLTTGYYKAPVDSQVVDDIDMSSDIDNSLDALYSALNYIFDYQANNLDGGFVPYNQDNVDWFTPTYKVITDQESQSLIDDFTSKIVTFIIIAYISYKAFTFIKKKTSRIMLEAEGALWKASEEASVGNLTDTTIKQYKKKTLKNNIVNKLTGNLLSGATNIGAMLSSSSDNQPSIETVIRLIRG